MGNIIICETKAAQYPFIFHSTKVEVFSYEELCFYIYHNMSLISIDFISDKFLTWLRKEIDMGALADKIIALKEKKTSEFTDILTEILAYKNYYSIPEIKAFLMDYERMKMLSEPEIEKLKADGFLRYRCYMKAISIYDEILEEKKKIKNQKLLGHIYHNKAVALSNNFEPDEAMRCFLKAYELAQTSQSIKEYLIVMASCKDKEQVEAAAEVYHVEKEVLEDIYEEIEDVKEEVKGLSIYQGVSQAMYNKEKNNLVDYERRMDAVLWQMKMEFREHTI